MRDRLPTLLLVLALPAGLVGYTIGVWLVRAVFGDAADGIVLLFVPLFLGGLAMVPFVLPFIDRRATADLAAIRGQDAAEAGAPHAPSGTPHAPSGTPHAPSGTPHAPSGTPGDASNADTSHRA